MIEVSYHAVTMGKVVNRGFLNGPLCPVYGSGVLMVLMVVDLCGEWFGFETDLTKASTIELFIIGIIFATLIELIAGFLLDQMFHARWWDYSKIPLNLNGRIALPVLKTRISRCFPRAFRDTSIRPPSDFPFRP